MQHTQTDALQMGEQIIATNWCHYNNDWNIRLNGRVHVCTGFRDSDLYSLFCVCVSHLLADLTQPHVEPNKHNAPLWFRVLSRFLGGITTVVHNAIMQLCFFIDHRGSQHDRRTDKYRFYVDVIYCSTVSIMQSELAGMQMKWNSIDTTI